MKIIIEINSDTVFDTTKKISENLINNGYIQKTLETNHKLYQQLEKSQEAIKLLKEMYTHLHEKAIKTTWETKKDANKWGEILDEIKKMIDKED